MVMVIPHHYSVILEGPGRRLRRWPLEILRRWDRPHHGELSAAMNRGNLGIEDYEDFIQTGRSDQTQQFRRRACNDRGESDCINTAIISTDLGGIRESDSRFGESRPPSDGPDHGSRKVTRAYLGISSRTLPGIAKRQWNTENIHGALVETSSVRPAGKPVSREAISFWRSMATGFRQPRLLDEYFDDEADADVKFEDPRTANKAT